MAILTSAWLLRWKWLLLAIGLPILIALWWAFRPEKLWINQTVNEAAPFDAASDPQPVLTGRFVGKAQPISGRATIYKSPGGRVYLRLSDFSTPNGENLHVELSGGSHQTDLGSLKSNSGDQNYDLPAAADLSHYDAVIVDSEPSHAVLGVAKLEPF
jgi:Electron transfer DM13